jgi:WD40 repeat protein
MKQPALSLVLEFTRTEQATDAYAFRMGQQEYLLRREGGEFVSATLNWNESLIAELAALRLPGRRRELPQQLGELLRNFVAPLRWGEYAAQIEAATARGQRVLLTLRSAAAELYALPWELLSLGPSGQHIAELPELLLRYEWPGTRTATAVAAGPRGEGGRILFAFSAAGGAVPASEQLAAIRDACQRGYHQFEVERDVLPQVSYARLAIALDAAQREGPPIEVLHILCHGAAEGGTFGLCFDGPDGDAVSVDAGQLRQLLTPYSAMLQLVVLCACDSGNTGTLGNVLGSIAQTLHRAGIAAVVSSRYPLSVAGACSLAKTLYTELLVGLRSLESALLIARRRLLEQADFDWAALQLYSHSADGDDSRPIVFRPFRGLLAFHPEHQRFFFGREREISEIENDLQALITGNRPRLLIIAGASGSGKSSLVLAGAVPRLCAPVRRSTPLRFERLRAGDVAGLASLATSRAGSEEVLVVCDQFEELFTHVKDGTERQAWVLELWRLCSDAKSGISALLTMRVDFIGRCGEILIDAGGRRFDAVAYDEAHRIFVAQLDPTQMEMLIRAPAEQTGLLFEEGLVQRILQDVGLEPGALPLLEYTLDLLWQRRQGRLLTQAGYDAVGCVSGALHGRAEALFFGMEQAVQRATRRLLTRLVEVGAEPAQGTRRRIVLSELRPRTGSDSFNQALALLVEARLLVCDSSGATQTVEIAHEALIRRWPRLVDWVREDRQMIADLERLESWTKERDLETPLTGKQLDAAEEIVAKYRDDLSPQAVELVARSQAERSRQRWYRQLLLIGLTASTLLFAIVGWFGWTSSRAAKRAESAMGMAKIEAERQAGRAVVAEKDAKRQLYDSYVERGRVLLVERNDPVRALMWLDRAYQQHHDTPSLRLLLGRSYYLTRSFQYRLDGLAPAFSPNGTYLLTEDKGEIKVYAAADGQLLRSFPGRAPSFAADGVRLVVSRDDYQSAVVIELSSGKTLLTLKAPGRQVGRASFSPNGMRLVSISPDGKLAALWNAEDGSLVTALPIQVPTPSQYAHTPDSALRLVQFSSDGKYIVSSGDCPLFIWDGASGKQLWHSEFGEEEEACFSIYAGRSESIRRFWELGGMAQEVKILDVPRQALIEISKRPRVAYTLALSPDGKHMVTVSMAQVPELHDLTTTSRPQALSGASLEPMTPLFSASGELVMTDDHASVYRLWDVSSARLLQTVSAQGAARVLSPDGKLLVSEINNGSVTESQVYDIARYNLLPGLREARFKQPLTPEATLCLTNNAKRQLRLDMANGQAVIIRHANDDTEVSILEDSDREDACFTHDGDYVVTWKRQSTSDSESTAEPSNTLAKIWDIETGALLTILSGEAAEKLIGSLLVSPRLLTASGKPWQLRDSLALPDHGTLKSYIEKELPLRFQGDVLIAKTAQ